MAPPKPAKAPEVTLPEDPAFDIDLAQAPVIHHRAVLWTPDDQILGTFENVVTLGVQRLIVKVAFKSVADWDNFLQLSFWLRQGLGKRLDNDEPMEPLTLCHARAGMDTNCIRTIETVLMNRATHRPNLAAEPRGRFSLEQDRLYLLTITYHPNRIRPSGFAVPVVGGTSYPPISQVLALLGANENPSLRLLVQTNQHFEAAVDEFRQQQRLQLPDYTPFYPHHPTKHFIQLGDYPSAATRPSLSVPAVTTFDTESRYQTVIGFGVIGEHEYVVDQAEALSQVPFTLRLMEIPHSNDRQYLGFLTAEDTTARLETDDRLKINFDFDARVEGENWSATVIDPLPWAPRGFFCVILHRRYDRESNTYDEKVLQPAPTTATDIPGASKALLSAIPYRVAVTQTISEKPFQRQVNALHRLSQDDAFSWWRRYLLGGDIAPQFHRDIYQTCSDDAMQLHRPTNFNEPQQAAVAYMRKLPNGIGLISGPAGSGKTMFVMTMIEVFLHSPSVSSPPTSTEDDQPRSALAPSNPNEDPAGRDDQPSSSSKPAEKESDKTESTKEESAKTESGKKESAKTESSKKESAKTESTKEESAKKESAEQEPVKKESAEQEPATKEPSIPTRPPAADPVGREWPFAAGADGSGEREFDPIQPPSSSGVLICAPANATVDALAERLYTKALADPMTKHAIVIRMHPMDVESDYVAYRARPPRPDRPNAVDPVVQAQALAELRIAKLVHDIYQAHQHHPHGVRDRRFLKPELSLAHWMLVIAGVIVTDPPHPKCAADKHKAFNGYYERMQHSEDLDPQDRRSFGLARFRLACHTLSLANVVVCTFATAGEGSMYRSIRPALIVCEESSRATEADVVMLLGNYPPTPLVLIGDEAQLRPLVKSTQVNGFVAQLEVSLFERLILLGQDHVLFRTQHRFVHPIGDMISKYFYRSQLIHAAGTALSERPFAGSVKAYFRTAFDVDSCLLLMRYPNTTQDVDGTMSRFNVDNVHAVLRQVTTILEQTNLVPEEVLILTPYQAQLKLYDRALRHLSWTTPTPRAADIRVSTVDNIQGSEGTLVILDIVSTKNIGFLSHRTRLNVACSRARDGLIIFGDIQGVMQAHKRERKHFTDICNYLGGNRWLHDLPAQPEHPSVLSLPAPASVSAGADVERDGDGWDV